MEEYMVPCLSKSLFGMECLGCGTQRAFLFVMRGEFILAFKMFPAIYTTILLFAFIGLHFLDKSRSYHKLIIGFAIVNAAIMIISYIYKMSSIN
jgi:hypothetical protein